MCNKEPSPLGLPTLRVSLRGRDVVGQRCSGTQCNIEEKLADSQFVETSRSPVRFEKLVCFIRQLCWCYTQPCRKKLYGR